MSVRKRRAKEIRASRRGAERWLAVIVTLTAVFALPARGQCPVGTSTTACSAVEACVERVYEARPAAAGVTEGEAALASERDAYRACAYAAESRAQGEGAAVTTLTASISMCPDPLIVEACPTLLEQLAVGSAVCAGCAGLGVLGGAYVASGACR